MDPQAPSTLTPEELNKRMAPPAMPRDSHMITIVSMAVFVLLSLAAVVFLYYQNQQLKTMLAGYKQAQATPTPTATADPTSNWKTYTSASLGIIVKYPQSWFVESDKNDSVRIQNYDPATAPGRGYDPVADKGSFAFQIDLQKFTTNPIATDQLKLILDKNGDSCFYVGDPAGMTVITNEIIKNINGYQSYTRTRRCSQLPESTASTVTYILDGKGKTVSFRTLLDVTSEISTFGQILSTFKFTTATASPSAKPVACTQEAKLCPDGSSVGRTGPNCEFAPCP